MPQTPNWMKGFIAVQTLSIRNLNALACSPLHEPTSSILPVNFASNQQSPATHTNNDPTNNSPVVLGPPRIASFDNRSLSTDPSLGGRSEENSRNHRRDQQRPDPFPDRSMGDSWKNAVSQAASKNHSRCEKQRKSTCRHGEPTSRRNQGEVTITATLRDAQGREQTVTIPRASTALIQALQAQSHQFDSTRTRPVSLIERRRLLAGNLECFSR